MTPTRTPSRLRRQDARLVLVTGPMSSTNPGPRIPHSTCTAPSPSRRNCSCPDCRSTDSCSTFRLAFASVGVVQRDRPRAGERRKVGGVLAIAPVEDRASRPPARGRDGGKPIMPPATITRICPRVRHGSGFVGAATFGVPLSSRGLVNGSASLVDGDSGLPVTSKPPMNWAMIGVIRRERRLGTERTLRRSIGTDTRLTGPPAVRRRVTGGRTVRRSQSSSGVAGTPQALTTGDLDHACRSG